MKLSDFSYHLPQEKIALTPKFPRESAKLLVASGFSLQDKIVGDLPDFIRENDVLVFNNSKVIPAQLNGISDGKKVSVYLISFLDNNWRAFAKPAKRLKIGSYVEFGDDFKAQVIDKKEDGQIELKFDYAFGEFRQKLEQYGKMPIPPYIAKMKAADDSDRSNYQTVFAEIEGSVAAPTAGLHYTKELLEKIKAKGAEIVFVTLHVGAGTFLPVKVDNIDDHKMHSEYYEVGAECAERINKARSLGGRVFAVGTTSLRTLESVADKDGNMSAKTGDTDIFIRVGYKFKIVDVLLTNFHFPESTLLMLVSAFLGFEETKNVYDHAINSDYRFYSYGDTSLLYRKQND